MPLSAAVPRSAHKTLAELRNPIQGFEIRSMPFDQVLELVICVELGRRLSIELTEAAKIEAIQDFIEAECTSAPLLHISHQFGRQNRIDPTT